VQTYLLINWTGWTKLADTQHKILNGYQGFINVSTQLQIPGSSQNWAVQNLPIAFVNPSELNGRLAESTTFDLGIVRGSINLESLSNAIMSFGLAISATPVNSMPAISYAPIGIQTLQVLFGGVADTEGGSSGSSGRVIPLPAQNFVGALPGEKQSTVGKIFGEESAIPAVDEEINGCAPGSVARSLKYMAAQNGLTVPGTVQDVYDVLKDSDHMKTSLGEDGTGTLVSMTKAGKDKYVKEKELGINTKQTKDVEEAKKTLKNKGDVEISVRFKGKDENGNDIYWGHMAFVSEIIDLTDEQGNPTGYTVKYIDDAKQGDGLASNKTHTVTFNSDGTGRASNVVRLINFQVETVPEPGTLALLVVGLIGIASSARKRLSRRRQ
jgi:hypothetical protein